MEEKDLFVKINNNLITAGSEYHLTEKELFVYSMLSRYMNRERIVRTTISLLSSFSPIKLTSREDTSVKLIKESLLTLKEKGIISIFNTYGESISDMKAHSAIGISLNELMGYGHVQVPYTAMDAIESITDYYIYVAVARWEKVGGFNSSYERWGQILGRSRRSAISVVNDAVLRGVVHKNIGDYHKEEVSDGEQKEQDQNIYRLTPFKDAEKTLMTKRNEKQEEFDEEIQNAIEIFKTYHDGNGYSTFPDEHDYILYIQVAMSVKISTPTKQETELLKVAKNRIRQMKNNPKFLGEWESALDFYYETEGIEFDIKVF